MVEVLCRILMNIGIGIIMRKPLELGMLVLLWRKVPDRHSDFIGQDNAMGSYALYPEGIGVEEVLERTQKAGIIK